ncbi:hypothetical protein BCR34DRAFT_580893 [Clohesyomyces aquaticus]|uniref:Uncharacterized protein n=1 Tax=Clohesyomyces aquaticus TaxID=1231657 RepID=A0A1Y1Y439_9PLEO|nr:hypothetical protein BCR34DRAFT_580893 [Clohesyomyces aquaticus]
MRKRMSALLGLASMSNPAGHPIVAAARSQPSKIDSLLRPFLSSQTFPQELELMMNDYVNTSATPGLHGDTSPHRPQWYYANSLLYGMLLGRAFTLLSTPTRPPRSLSDAENFPFKKLPAELRFQIYEYYKEDLAQRQGYWDVMTRIFVKALWSGPQPEEGSRYAAGVLLLSCGHALSLAAPLLRGRGRRWMWWDGEIKDPGYIWGWEELYSVVMKTANLPRGNTDINELRKRWEEAQQDGFFSSWVPGQVRDVEALTKRYEYVSKQVLEVMDLAREHLQADERDWTPPEMTVKFLNQLFEGNEEGRRVWEAKGITPGPFDVAHEEGEHESVGTGS